MDNSSENPIFCSSASEIKNEPEDILETEFIKFENVSNSTIKLEPTSEEKISFDIPSQLVTTNKISVLKNSFNGLSLEEKLQVKELGRTTPDLQIEKLSGGRNTRCRKFTKTIYSKNNWLCGCEETNKLYCFVCVLFGGDETWSKNGTDDVVHIWEKMKTHERSKVHMNNVFSFSMIGKVNIKTQLNSVYRNALILHNDQVDKNRYILNKAINCIRFCGAFELALRGYDEEDLENSGIFKEMINFSTELDKELIHIQNSEVFKGTSKTSQNELLECMLDIYQEEVTKEIENSPFVAVIGNETIDVAGEFQLVIIFRYLCKGRPVERFWTFYMLNEEYNTKSIAECILNILDPLLINSYNKLIAQTYDGAYVMSGKLNGVQDIIKDTYPLANFVHCYAHQINLIMTSTCSVNKQARIFFSNLSGLCSFFSFSPQRIKTLDEVVSRSRTTQTLWNFQSRPRGVHIVYEHRQDLITVMEIIESTSTDACSINQASGYKLKLQDKHFMFWLSIFHQIMPHVEVVFNQLQKVCTDSVQTVKKHLENFEVAIETIREQMDSIIDNIDQEINSSQTESDEPLIKRAREEADSEDTRKWEALEVCDAVLWQINTRFNFSGHLVASNLFMSEKFKTYRREFPEDFLSETCSQFPVLNKNQLKRELEVLYQRDELSTTSGAVPLSILLNEEGLSCTFQETLTLLSILITTPMPTFEAERCFPLLKHTKTFLRNTIKEEKLSALGMLSVEKHFVNRIENFNNKVIENFANKNGRKMDFIYRKF